MTASVIGLALASERQLLLGAAACRQAEQDHPGSLLEALAGGWRREIEAEVRRRELRALYHRIGAV